MTDDAFEVDIDTLLDVIDRMATCESSLHALAADITRRMDGLHLTWQGAASDAHMGAQESWDRGFHDMRAALQQMRAAAHTAHDNYTSAADTNRRLWEQVG